MSYFKISDINGFCIKINKYIKKTKEEEEDDDERHRNKSTCL